MVRRCQDTAPRGRFPDRLGGPGCVARARGASRDGCAPAGGVGARAARRRTRRSIIRQAVFTTCGKHGEGKHKMLCFCRSEGKICFPTHWRLNRSANTARRSPAAFPGARARSWILDGPQEFTFGPRPGPLGASDPDVVRVPSDGLPPRTRRPGLPALRVQYPQTRRGRRRPQERKNHGTYLQQPRQVRPGPRRPRGARLLRRAARREDPGHRHARGRRARRREGPSGLRGGGRRARPRGLRRRVLRRGDRAALRRRARGRLRRRRRHRRRQGARHGQGGRPLPGRARHRLPHRRVVGRALQRPVRHLHRRRRVRPLPVPPLQPRRGPHGLHGDRGGAGAPHGLGHGRCARHVLRGEGVRGLRGGHLRGRQGDRRRARARAA